ncbi:hypothetical protein MNEG_14918 [Monoraphidium neglectum]|uniref:Uncharacterized protein n=1 Tax=Monoraphidium neglectum TaxID=145388 RepID=A0A0D2MCS4_9CHLO|nr:hypothetical protein MNEG_14918 [Monoraphidium neglectum]KIY93045.1 hypothetical protein MNEG_14918 [Monoraphidium neglectum]|eukprot:XP_013892065.1 hypothetical protein MNEG_14918 [Monoraphidium neglectum]
MGSSSPRPPLHASQELESALRLQNHYKQRAKDALAAAAEREADGAAERDDRASAAAAAAEEEVEELQDEVVRLRSAAEANLRSAAEDQFAAELTSLSKAKAQAQRECDALRDLAAQAAAQHREELARWVQENAALKARIASDAAAAAMGGGAGAGRGAGKTFGALQGGGGFGGGAAAAVERFVAALERRKRGLAPLVAVAAVVLLVAFVAVVRAASSGRGGTCVLHRLGIIVGPGCGRPGGAAAGGGGGGPLLGRAGGGGSLRRLLDVGSFWEDAG